MNVSRNEMNTALKRAYEGAGYDVGDYEDAAEQITWAEMCGFNVFSLLTLPPLGPKGSATPRLVFEDAGVAVIDAGGADVCQYGSLAGYLAFSKSAREGLVTVQLANCSSPLLVLRSLSFIAQRGTYLAAYWRDTRGAHGASFESGEMFPNYWCVSSEEIEPPASCSTVTIMCTTCSSLLANAIDADVKEQPLVQLSSAQLAANYDAALQNGIGVSAAQWDALNAAAWPILVPASEHSRGGAGPA